MQTHVIQLEIQNVDITCNLKANLIVDTIYQYLPPTY